MIDLTFASGDIVSYTIYYKVDTSLDYNSDYLPITVVIDWNQQLATLLRKWLQAKTNLQLLQQTVKDRLPPVPDTTELYNKNRINEYI